MRRSRILLLTALAAGALAAAPSLAQGGTNANGWNCTIDMTPGYQKSGTVPTSLSGSWTLSYVNLEGSSRMWARAGIETNSYSIYMHDKVYYDTGHYRMQPQVQWKGTAGSGSWNGPVYTDAPFTDTFNFARQGDGTYSVYLNGTLVVSGVSFGSQTPNLDWYDYYMLANNPCVDMDGTFSVANSLVGWTPDLFQYYVVNLIDNYDFEVYTLPF